MTKKETIAEIKNATGGYLTENEIDGVLAAFITLIRNNEQLSYPGLGIFKRYVRKPRKRFNPITKNEYIDPGKTILKFKACKETREYLNRTPKQTG